MTTVKRIRKHVHAAYRTGHSRYTNESWQDSMRASGRVGGTTDEELVRNTVDLWTAYTTTGLRKDESENESAY